MFIEASFIIAKSRNNFPMDEWLKKQRLIYTMALLLSINAYSCYYMCNNLDGSQGNYAELKKSISNVTYYIIQCI